MPQTTLLSGLDDCTLNLNNYTTQMNHTFGVNHAQTVHSPSAIAHKDILDTCGHYGNSLGNLLFVSAWLCPWALTQVYIEMV